jgi:hypothetical protein
MSPRNESSLCATIHRSLRQAIVNFYRAAHAEFGDSYNNDRRQTMAESMRFTERTQTAVEKLGHLMALILGDQFPEYDRGIDPNAMRVIEIDDAFLVTFSQEFAENISTRDGRITLPIMKDRIIKMTDGA